MPTRIAILGRERTVATLAKRLYKIDGRDAAEKQRRAEVALVRANPRLVDAKGFRSGGRVVVPAVVGLETTDEVAAAKTSGEGLNSETALRLQAMEGLIANRFGRDREIREKTIGQIDTQDFRAEARKALPESAKAIDQTLERLGKADEESKAVEERLTKAVGAALEGLETIEQVFRKSNPR